MFSKNKAGTLWSEFGSNQAKIAKKYNLGEGYLKSPILEQFVKMKILEKETPMAYFIKHDIEDWGIPKLFEKIAVGLKSEKKFIIIHLTIATHSSTDLCTCGSSIPMEWDKNGNDINREKSAKEVAEKKSRPTVTWWEKKAVEDLGVWNYRNHGVCVFLDKKQKVIIYKDPQGHKMPDKLQKGFENELASNPLLKEYKLLCNLSRQQHPSDEINCGIINFHNMLSFYQGKPLEKFPEHHYIAIMESIKQDMVDKIEKAQCMRKVNLAHG